MDTPLHNAARWNHPALVNELLLYGASYTATNNDNKTPTELSSEEEVKELIWKASNGVIAVGSYSPFKQRVERVPHIGKVSKLAAGGQQPGGRDVGNNPGSGERNDLLFHYPSSLQAKARDDRQLKDFESSSSKSCELLEEDEDEAYVVVDEGEHHRVLGTQEMLGNLEGSSEERGACGIGERIGGEQGPHGSEGHNGEELGERPHPNSLRGREEEHEERPQPLSQELPAHIRREPVEQRLNPPKQLPKRDEKLISLLQAIEAFDRFVHSIEHGQLHRNS